MPTYYETIKPHKDELKVVVMHIVDDQTLRQNYVILVNYRMDYGLVTENLRHFGTTSHKKLRKKVGGFKRVLGRRHLKLVRTDNSLGYTRLIYELV